MSDIVERARHTWANMRPISPDLVISLVTEIERLRDELWHEQAARRALAGAQEKSDGLDHREREIMRLHTEIERLRADNKWLKELLAKHGIFAVTEALEGK